jgi:hypothetical protein
MSYKEKCIDCTNIRVGDYWSAFESNQDSLPFFPKFNSLSVENTKYSNRFKIRISNNGAFGFNYSLTQGQYSSVLKREYSILFVLLKLVFAAYYLYFIFASFAFENRDNFDKYMEYLFFIMIPITLILVLSYSVSKKYFKLVESFVLKYKSEVKLPESAASARDVDGVKETDTFDRTYYAVRSIDEVLDEDHYVDFDTTDTVDDPREALKELLLDNIDCDDEAVSSLVETLNIELIDVTYNAAQALYKSFEADNVDYNEFVLAVEKFLGETNVIHGCRYEKIYIAGGDLDKEHIYKNLKFGIWDTIICIALVVYPDETIAIVYRQFKD